MDNRRILITGGSGFIGTNLISLFINKGYLFINLDKNSPKIASQKKYWVNINLLNFELLRDAIENYSPAIVIHLAARTDGSSNDINDYIDNTEGTRNLVKVLENSDTVLHFINTSTQYVYKSKMIPFPPSDNDYLSYSVYGESKKICEEVTRNSKMKCAWTIIRPTNVWGPWHMRYPDELWKIIDKGWYVHPGRKEIIRTYAYVNNVIHQIDAIINSPLEKVNKQTFYLGDNPIDSMIWLNGFSIRLRNKTLRRLPSILFKILAFVGDCLKIVKLEFPIYSSRYKNMVEDYYAPTNVTIKMFGLKYPDLSTNIDDTIKWLEKEGYSYFKYWTNKHESLK